MSFGIWQRTITDDAGNVLPGASIEVREPSSDFTGALVFLFSNEAGSTGLANPFNADSEGFAQFYAAPRKVDIRATGSGSQRTWRNVEILGTAATQPTSRFPYVVGSVADLRAIGSGVAEPGQTVSTKGYYADGDGGSNDYVIELLDGSADDGGSVIYLDDGVHQARAIFPGGVYDSRQWGATGAGDESVLYQAAVDYLLSIGARYLTVDLDHDTAMTITNRSNIVFTGRGSFVGTNYNTGVYRRQVIPAEAKPATAYKDPGLRINANKMGAVKVVVTGDSLTTFGADALSATDGVTERLVREITVANPDMEFEFVGRGIGAQRWVNLDGLPSVSYPIADRYPWYTDDTRAWLEYIFDENPDFVVISMGINDKQNLDRAAVESVVAKIEATGARVILVTNLGVNLSPHPDLSSFGTYDDQEGRDYAAGWIRTYAQYHGHPLIDLNRTFNMVRDGRDILDTYLVEQDEVTFGSASPFVAAESQRCRDFSINADIVAAAWTNVDPFSVQLSSGTNNTVFVDDDDGFLRFKFYRGDTNSLYLTETSDIPTPTVESEVEISVRGNQFAFRIMPAAAGAKAGVQPYTREVIRYGGNLKPAVNYFGGGGTGPVTRALLSVGVDRPYVPALTDIEMYGAPTSSTAQKPVTGGNGVNHPTAKGSTFLYGLHFSEQNVLFNPGVEIIEDAQGVCYRHADGRQECEAVIEAPGGATGAEGALFVGASIGWSFAAPFIEAPIVYGSADRFTYDVVFNAGGTTPKISNGIRPRATTSDANPVNLRVRASGRWKN